MHRGRVVGGDQLHRPAPDSSRQAPASSSSRRALPSGQEPAQLAAPMTQGSPGTLSYTVSGSSAPGARQHPHPTTHPISPAIFRDPTARPLLNKATQFTTRTWAMSYMLLFKTWCPSTLTSCCWRCRLPAPPCSCQKARPMSCRQAGGGRAEAARVALTLGLGFT